MLRGSYNYFGLCGGRWAIRGSITIVYNNLKGIKMGNISILWDIENIKISSQNINLFLTGLNSYVENIGNKSYSIAVGDWLRDNDKIIPSALSENGFELIYIPQIQNNGKKTKDSVDFVLITKATEMIFQYPHIDTYILITSDQDFRPLIQLLKKHGKKVLIIYNADNVTERLLELADEHKDYRDLIPDETDYEEENVHSIADKIENNEAFNLLYEAVLQMENLKKVPTPGSVKVRMKMINEQFSSEKISFNSWMDFIVAAERNKIIKTTSKNNDTVLSVIKKKDTTDSIFKTLLEVMNEKSPNKKWITFTAINQKLISKGINIKEHNYTRFKLLAIAAEKEGLIEIKNDGLKWQAKIK